MSLTRDKRRSLRLGISDAMDQYEPLTQRQFVDWWSKEEGATKADSAKLWEAYLLGYGSIQCRKNPDDGEFEWDIPSRIEDQTTKNAYFRAARDEKLVAVFATEFAKALVKQGYSIKLASEIVKENTVRIDNALYRMTSSLDVPVKRKKQLKVKPTPPKQEWRPGLSKLVVSKLSPEKHAIRGMKEWSVTVEDLFVGMVIYDDMQNRSFVVGGFEPNVRNTVDVVLTKVAGVRSRLAKPLEEPIILPRKRKSTRLIVEVDQKTKKALVDEDLFQY